ncbi:4780_t:CDS:2, partial [Racocetra persica]
MRTGQYYRSMIKPSGPNTATPIAYYPPVSYDRTGDRSSSAQFIVWMNERRCQSKDLYEDTNGECIQNDKTGRSEDIYKRLLATDLLK